MTGDPVDLADRRFRRDLRRMTGESVNLAERRFRRDVERLHALGPRPLLELLVELGERYTIRTEIEQLVRRYSRLDPRVIDALGARWLR
jgi:hypothetical protein